MSERGLAVGPGPSSPGLRRRSDQSRSTPAGGVIERVIAVLDLARTGKASAEDFAEASLALGMLQERLLSLFAFPAFPEDGEGIVRLGTWDSLLPAQRSAYTEIKAMVSSRRR